MQHHHGGRVSRPVPPPESKEEKRTNRNAERARRKAKKEDRRGEAPAERGFARVAVVLLVGLLALALAACEMPQQGFGENGQRPSVQVNVAPVYNGAPSRDWAADSSSWGESSEGTRSGTNTPTNTVSPDVSVPAGVNATPPAIPAPGGVSMKPAGDGAAAGAELVPDVLTGTPLEECCPPGGPCEVPKPPG